MNYTAAPDWTIAPLGCIVKSCSHCHPAPTPLMAELMTDAAASLTGLRILIVEDELMIAMAIEDILRDLQCEPVGPASTIKTALEIIRSDAKIDGVLLDMNLHGEPVYPVIDELVAKKIVFILTTGYPRRDDDPPTVQNALRLIKPFSMATLSEAMAKAFIRLE